MKLKVFLWIIIAAIIGEISLAFFTTIAQEVLFDGIDYNTSAQTELIVGGIFTLIAAILAGIVASLAIKNKSYWPHIIISFLIVAEMTYLISTGKTSGPFWFSAGSGLSLIIGVWAGYYLMNTVSNSPARIMR